MKCKEFREKMYLRNDELEARELSEVERHRLECIECGAEYARVASMLKITDTLKTQKPELNDPLLLTNSILSRISEDVLRAHPPRRESFFGQFVQLMAAPNLRMTMAILLFLITGLFAVEYTSGYMHLKGYEERIHKSGLQQQNAAVSLSHRGQLPDAAEYLLRVISGHQSFVEVSDNWVLLDKRSLKNYLMLYDALKHNDSELSPGFRAAHPHLSTLLTVKQQSVQLEILLKERESLIHELNRLVHHERQMP